jgi:hypothetical protein
MWQAIDDADKYEVNDELELRFTASSITGNEQYFIVLQGAATLLATSAVALVATIC